MAVTILHESAHHKFHHYVRQADSTASPTESGNLLERDLFGGLFRHREDKTKPGWEINRLVFQPKGKKLFSLVPDSWVAQFFDANNTPTIAGVQWIPDISTRAKKFCNKRSLNIAGGCGVKRPRR
eukprot:TRINITY_DN10530_c0_g1_i1.p1 TRINITY_DN10530_c0_g1~~TRINITY_DN10530_c0_g1_i1.p1  ORF type:complete len:125 (+),score=16.34 TRINITY_DN10530_c0_g1_i1:373-747(+)